MTSHTHTIAKINVRRIATCALTAAAFALLPSVMTAQVSINTSYASGCGPATSCGLVWFTLLNAGTSQMQLNTLTLTRTSGTSMFIPAGGVGTYDGQDDLGPLGGFTTVNGTGSGVFIDFINTGDPSNPGFPLTLDGNGSGSLELALDPTTLPVTASTLAFSFSGDLAAGGPVSGQGNVVSVTPEPSSMALLGGGLLAMVPLLRRRRPYQSSDDY